jgi:hypothetical protein
VLRSKDTGTSRDGAKKHFRRREYGFRIDSCIKSLIFFQVVQYQYKPEYLERFPTGERKKLAKPQTGVIAQVAVQTTPPPPSGVSCGSALWAKKDKYIFVKEEMRKSKMWMKK